MDPLLTLGPLAADIEELVGKLANLERSLGDTSGLDTGAEDVLIGGHVVGRGHAVDGVEVVDCGVVELELALDVVEDSTALGSVLGVSEGSDGRHGVRGR